MPFLTKCMFPSWRWDAVGEVAANEKSHGASSIVRRIRNQWRGRSRGAPAPLAHGITPRGLPQPGLRPGRNLAGRLGGGDAKEL